MALSILSALAAWRLPFWAAAVPLAALLFTAWFFRDPERAPPTSPDAIASPADGKIIRADAARLSVFMNVFDVHVCRAPLGGVVAAVRRTPGSFAAAFRDSASEHNERTEIEITTAAGPLRFTLVAGLVARRIVCRVAEGQRLAIGERVGLIRFGSRVDVELPPGAAPAVRVGDRVVAGISVVARLSGNGPEAGA